jgi:hypothetical protein
VHVSCQAAPRPCSAAEPQRWHAGRLAGWLAARRAPAGCAGTWRPACPGADTCAQMALGTRRAPGGRSSAACLTARQAGPVAAPAQARPRRPAAPQAGSPACTDSGGVWGLGVGRVRRRGGAAGPFATAPPASCAPCQQRPSSRWHRRRCDLLARRSAAAWSSAAAARPARGSGCPALGDACTHCCSISSSFAWLSSCACNVSTSSSS